MAIGKSPFSAQNARAEAARQHMMQLGAQQQAQYNQAAAQDTGLLGDVLSIIGSIWGGGAGAALSAAGQVVNRNKGEQGDVVQPAEQMGGVGAEPPRKETPETPEKPPEHVGSYVPKARDTLLAAFERGRSAGYSSYYAPTQYTTVQA